MSLKGLLFVFVVTIVMIWYFLMNTVVLFANVSIHESLLWRLTLSNKERLLMCLWS